MHLLLLLTHAATGPSQGAGCLGPSFPEAYPKTRTQEQVIYQGVFRETLVRKWEKQDQKGEEAKQRDSFEQSRKDHFSLIPQESSGISIKL